MTDESIPIDRFAWLGIAPPPDGIVVPEDTSFQITGDLLKPNQVNSQDGLGIFRWLMADEDERKDALTGCTLFDNFVYMDIPEAGD